MSETTGATNEEVYQFQAEVHRVLEIVVNSLYKYEDIFLRELISNAVDALNRVRFERLQNTDIQDPDLELKITITPDEENNTLTISDTGIGMSKEELKENLGTIASSGTLKFLEKIKDQVNADTLPELIGQFGVGFYSVFMVADEVIVRSKSFRKDDPPYEWVSKGGNSYTIRPADKKERGTDIIIKLKENKAEYTKEYKIREIIKKYSDYVPFPIYLGEEVINQQTPIWRKSPSELKDEDYEKFYQYVSHAFDKPFHTIHYNIDAPIMLRSILFIPPTASRNLLFPDVEWGPRLYSRNVLIQEHAKDILPNYFRFIQGVVDCEDIPLNVSRETIQVSAVTRKIKKALTAKIFKELRDMAKREPERYLQFWKEFGIFLKEGYINDLDQREKIIKLLRFQTNKTKPDEYISLDEYLKRMPKEQDKIYYLFADSLDIAKQSPHLEYYEDKGWEVLFFVEPADAFLLLHLREYQGKTFQAIDSATETAQTTEQKEETEKTEEEKTETATEKEKKTPDTTTPYQPLIDRIKAVLGDKIMDVKVTDRLKKSPCRLASPATGFGSEFERVYKYLNEKAPLSPQKILEINVEHNIIKNLNTMIQKDPSNPLINQTIEQLYENSLLQEGLLQNPAEMIPRIYEILNVALEKSLPSTK